MSDLKQMLDENCRKYPKGPMADVDEKVSLVKAIVLKGGVG